jgi:hypothetical protein
VAEESVVAARRERESLDKKRQEMFKKMTDLEGELKKEEEEIQGVMINRQERDAKSIEKR